ncbi:hypothetical protein HF673_00165 [Acidithiobacillus thiooxidans]|uniref:hypothetical protein n=1 Tax=Acidithiobacillus thiooxidans TaxID=930 RepID=UPI001C076A20|nr:hypothetical protein [Acidithiobacillus thiooxidans]MBU2834231.1 hypothetical protein [Acidithiobacillus thiooxidans]
MNTQLFSETEALFSALQDETALTAVFHTVFGEASANLYPSFSRKIRYVEATELNEKEQSLVLRSVIQMFIFHNKYNAQQVSKDEIEA